MPMKRPPHPGRILKDEVLAPHGLDVTQAARVLGVARSTLSKLLNQRASLSPEMALRVEKAFGPRADHLMRMQMAFDMAEARCGETRIHVKPYRPIGS